MFLLLFLLCYNVLFFVHSVAINTVNNEYISVIVKAYGEVLIFSYTYVFLLVRHPR